MFTWLVSTTLTAAIVVFLLAECGVLLQIWSRDRRAHPPGRSRLLLTAWTLVPLLILAGLLLVARPSLQPATPEHEARTVKAAEAS